MKCWKCNKSVLEYVENESQPYCLECYEKHLANKCKSCGKMISAGEKAIKLNAFNWYHAPCFKCTKCQAQLEDKTFEKRKNKPYCGKCFGEAFIGKCFACDQVIEPGQSKIENEGKIWHDKCFICVTCKKPLVDIDIYPDDAGMHCEECFQNKVAAICKKCDKPIMGSFVEFHDHPFHEECMKCEKCNGDITKKQVIDCNGLPVCMPCYTKHYADKCAKCGHPITTAEAIVYENSKWHKPCFICTKCKKSLIGEGFLMKGHNILCEACKNKK